MKKLTTGFIAVVCILVLGSMTVFAAGQVQQRSSQQGGAADNSAERVYNHYNKYCSTESGCGYCGENGHCYVDEDGDGVCDYAGENCANGGSCYVDEDGDGVCDYAGENCVNGGSCCVDEDGDGICAAGGSCAAGYGCGDGHGHGHAYRR